MWPFYFFQRHKDACRGSTDAASVIRFYLQSPLSPLRSVLTTACRQQQNAELRSGRLHCGAEIGFVKLFFCTFGAIEVAFKRCFFIYFPWNNLYFQQSGGFFSFLFLLEKAAETNLFNKMFSNSKNVLFGKLSDLLGERSLRTNTFLVKFAPFSSRSRGSWRTFFVFFFFLVLFVPFSVAC